mmetsp:Transcript_55515/g.119827  ORF Transcript_55515/g.119827 Transcript_55515/m.119827 type:complete len:268 (+) Transcript_55515:66-869(+)
MAPRFRISRVFLAVMLSVASLLNSAEAALFLSRGNRSSLGDAVDDYQAGCRNVVRQLESSSKAEQLASCIGYGLAEVSCRTEQQYLGLAHWTAGSVAEVCVHLSSELVMLERAGSPRNVSFAQSMESTLQGKTDDYDGQPQEPLPPYNQSDPNPFINEDANTSTTVVMTTTSMPLSSTTPAEPATTSTTGTTETTTLPWPLGTTTLTEPSTTSTIGTTETTTASTTASTTGTAETTLLPWQLSDATTAESTTTSTTPPGLWVATTPS